MGSMQGGNGNQSRIDYESQASARGPGKGNRRTVADEVAEWRRLAKSAYDRGMEDYERLNAKATKIEREDAELTAEYGPAKEPVPYVPTTA